MALTFLNYAATNHQFPASSQYSLAIDRQPLAIIRYPTATNHQPSASSQHSLTIICQPLSTELVSQPSQIIINHQPKAKIHFP